MFKIFLVLALAVSLLLLAEQHNFFHQDKEVTNAHVAQIYNRIVVNSGEQGFPILIILDSDMINAWTDGENIVITTGMIEVLQNDDQIALVLSHEIAHFINRDVYHDDIDNRIVEAHADKLGAFLMMRAGFDVCKGKEVFRVFMAIFGDTAAPSSHPSNAYRLDQLNLPECRQEIF